MRTLPLRVSICEGVTGFEKRERGEGKEEKRAKEKGGKRNEGTTGLSGEFQGDGV